MVSEQRGCGAETAGALPGVRGLIWVSSRRSRVSRGRGPCRLPGTGADAGHLVLVRELRLGRDSEEGEGKGAILGWWTGRRAPTASHLLSAHQVLGATRSLRTLGAALPRGPRSPARNAVVSDS